MGNKIKDDSVYCDIGSENGVIAKIMAQRINAQELHMYEPFGTETKGVNLKNADSYFHKYDF